MSTRCLASLFLVLVLAGIGSAQDPSPKASPPAHEPTLDELLGLAPARKEPSSVETPAEPKGPPPDQGTLELDRALTEEQAAALLDQTARLMDDVAKRLGDAKDPGLQTQRLQDDVVKKLDRIIASAQQNQQQSRQRKQQQQQQQQQDQNVPQQQQQQKQASKSTPSTQAGTPNVAPQKYQGRSVRAGGAASWGSLPARVRDALQEGLSDTFSSKYRATTEEYYRRLAEDRSKGTPR